MMKNLNEAIRYDKKIIPQAWCKTFIKYADLKCKEKGTVVGEGYHKTREVFNYRFTRNIQDTAYAAYLQKTLTSSFNEYLSKFPYIYTLELEDLHLLKYNKGNYYQAHADYSSSTPRNLSVIVNLNEGYSGGALNFYDPQSFETRQKYSLKEGDSIIFPSNFLFPHSIDTIEKGTRYSIVAWLK